MYDCPICGGPRETRNTCGPLTTQLDPPGAWWHGKRFLVSPNQLKVLDLLCQRGKVSHLAVQLVGTGEDTGSNVDRVLATQLRKRLPSGIAITSVRGWGYELVIESEQEKAA